MASKAFQAVTNVGWLRDDRAAFVDRSPPNDGHAWYGVVLRDDLLRVEAAHAAEAARLRETLSWALDLLDMYDERLTEIDGAEMVYTPIHVAGKAKARAALASTEPDAARAEE